MVDVARARMHADRAAFYAPRSAAKTSAVASSRPGTAAMACAWPPARAATSAPRRPEEDARYASAVCTAVEPARSSRTLVLALSGWFVPSSDQTNCGGGRARPLGPVLCCFALKPLLSLSRLA